MDNIKALWTSLDASNYAMSNNKQPGHIKNAYECVYCDCNLYNSFKVLVIFLFVYFLDSNFVN